MQMAYKLKGVLEEYDSTKMEVSLQSFGSRTTIFDLNADCLREVFSHSNSADLIAIADVCARFREIAVQSARSKFKRLELYWDWPVEDYSMLRNFGASIKSVVLYRHLYRGSQEKRLIEPVVKSCVGESIVLELYHFGITDELAFLMLPLLGRVQKLTLSRCGLCEVFIKNLTVWSPELRELKLINTRSNGGIVQNFPKLESIWLDHSDADDIDNSVVSHFLKLNPQLKEFGLISCRGVDDSVLHSIAKYVPDIERLKLHSNEFDSTNRNHIEHFGQLRKLKSLSLRKYYENSYIQSALQMIASANIDLDSLELCLFENTHQIIHQMSKLHNLKTLNLTEFGIRSDLKAIHLIEMCKHLKQLSRFVFKVLGDVEITSADLLEFIRAAEKLSLFQCITVRFGTKINIDVDTFNELVSIVGQRCEKVKLNLILDEAVFFANIPAAITKAASNLLTLRIR